MRKMKLAVLILLLPAATADSASVNQARAANPKLRGGTEEHSLVAEFKEKRAHKKDISANSDLDHVEVVGPGKYFSQKEETARKEVPQAAIFRTSRLSRNEMEKRAIEMKAKLQQVEMGTLELNEKTVGRYKKFVQRYDELEKEIYRLNHPEEEEKVMKEEKEDSTNNNNSSNSNTAKKSISAYSSGKAEFEKSIKQLKEKKRIDVLVQNNDKDEVPSTGTSSMAKIMEIGKETVVMDATFGKTSNRAVDGVKHLEKPVEKIGSKGDLDNFEIVSEGKIIRPIEDNDDIPPNFEGLGKNTAEEEEPDDKVVISRQKGGDDKTAKKINNLAEIVSTTFEEKTVSKTEIVGEAHEELATVGKVATTTDKTTSHLKREGDNGSEDAGTEEMDRVVLEKFTSEIEGQKNEASQVSNP
jgi:hypothetical protein